MATQQQLATFEELKKRTDFKNDDELFALFDALPPVTVDEMIGKFQGSDMKTGHWAQEELVKTKWFGKSFRSQFDGVPLVSYRPDGKLASNGMMNGRSSLWEVPFRGKTSATMFYDGVPIFDHFRKVDDKTVFGVMNGKHVEGRPDIIADGRYYFFYLWKIDEFPVEYVDEDFIPGK